MALRFSTILAPLFSLYKNDGSFTFCRFTGLRYINVCTLT